MERRQRRSFTDDYKRQAVDLVASSGRSIGSVAKELWASRFCVAPVGGASRGRARADGRAAAPHNAGGTAVGGSGGRDRALAAGERAAAHGARHFKEVDCDLCWSPDMRFRFIEDRRASKDKSSEKKLVTSAVIKSVEGRELNCEHRVLS